MNRRLIAIPVVVVVGGVLWLTFGRQGSADGALAASGTVEVTEADLGFQVGGRVATILVREGARVDSGAVLARLDVTDLVARRAQADAQLAAQVARLRELESGARAEERAQAEAAAAAAEERRVEAGRAARRAEALFAGGAISEEQRDQARTALEVATQQARQAAEQSSLVRRGPRAEQLEAQRAAVRAAEAQVAQVEAALGHAEIRAPFAGVIATRHREPGEAVGPGLPVLSLMNPADRWVRIYVREDRIGAVHLGQAAEIRTDTFGDSLFAGEVVHIADEAEFTPRNVQTAEERLKLVYAVKVAVTGDAGLALKPGLPADVVLPSESR